jgi:hypothetical protein
MDGGSRQPKACIYARGLYRPGRVDLRERGLWLPPSLVSSPQQDPPAPFCLFETSPCHYVREMETPLIIYK